LKSLKKKQKRGGTNMGRPKAQLIKNSCEICGNTFQVKDTKRGRNKRTCSTTCARKLGSKNSVITYFCSICGDETTAYKHAVKQGLPVYCEECTHNRYKHECVICKEKFRSPNINTKTCSSKCQTEYRKSKVVKVNCDYCGKKYEQATFNIYKGKNNYCTKTCSNNGYSLKNPTRYGGNWNTIRNKIIERDNRNCLRCGSYDELEVHHFKPMLKFKNKKESHKRDNLGTFCTYCHREIEGKYKSLSDFKERYSPTFSEN